MAKKKVVADPAVRVKLNEVVFLLNALADEVKFRHPWAEYPEEDSREIKRHLNRIGNELANTLRYLTKWSPGEVQNIREGNHPLNEDPSPILKEFLLPPQEGAGWTNLRDGHYLRQIETGVAHGIIMNPNLSLGEKIEKLRRMSIQTSGLPEGVLYLPKSEDQGSPLEGGWDDFYETWVAIHGTAGEPV